MRIFATQIGEAVLGAEIDVVEAGDEDATAPKLGLSAIGVCGHNPQQHEANQNRAANGDAQKTTLYSTKLGVVEYKPNKGGVKALV